MSKKRSGIDIDNLYLEKKGGNKLTFCSRVVAKCVKEESIVLYHRAGIIAGMIDVPGSDDRDDKMLLYIFLYI